MRSENNGKAWEASTVEGNSTAAVATATTNASCGAAEYPHALRVAPLTARCTSFFAPAGRSPCAWRTRRQCRVTVCLTCSPCDHISSWSAHNMPSQPSENWSARWRQRWASLPTPSSALRCITAWGTVRAVPEHTVDATLVRLSYHSSRCSPLFPAQHYPFQPAVVTVGSIYRPGTPLTLSTTKH